jgi:hypothetical protein
MGEVGLPQRGEPVRGAAYSGPMAVTEPGQRTSAEPERCLRCAAPMEWRHQTWQCPVCRFKLGCCEGEDCSGYAAESAAIFASR